MLEFGLEHLDLLLCLLLNLSMVELGSISASKLLLDEIRGILALKKLGLSLDMSALLDLIVIAFLETAVSYHIF